MIPDLNLLFQYLDPASFIMPEEVISTLLNIPVVSDQNQLLRKYNDASG